MIYLPHYPSLLDRKIQGRLYRCLIGDGRECFSSAVWFLVSTDHQPCPMLTNQSGHVSFALHYKFCVHDALIREEIDDFPSSHVLKRRDFYVNGLMILRVILPSACFTYQGFITLLCPLQFVYFKPLRGLQTLRRCLFVSFLAVTSCRLPESSQFWSAFAGSS